MNRPTVSPTQDHAAEFLTTRAAFGKQRAFGHTALAVCLMLVGGIVSAAGGDVCKQQKSGAVRCDERPDSSSVTTGCLFQNYGGVNCETDMAYLDNYAISLQAELDTRAYVVIYGGRRDTGRREVNARLSRIKRYLTAQRGIEPDRVVTKDGGFREKLIVELWLVPKGQEPPKSSPTVSAKDVRFARNKVVDDCSIFY